jgi:excinuclease UvrABC nuclease subunit
MEPYEWASFHISEGIKAPAEPGCYALISKDKEILYIGRSKLLCNRINNPYKHKGFIRCNHKLNELKVAWKTGWNIYDKEKELILKYKPKLCIYYLE